METTALIDNITTQIEEVSDLFYQHKDHEGYVKLNDTIGFLLELAEQLKQLVAEQTEISLNEQEFLSVLNEALAALEEKDTVLLSDILQYDLTEQLDAMKKLLAAEE